MKRPVTRAQQPADYRDAGSNLRIYAITAAITIAVTAGLTIASAMSGGFASADPAGALARDTGVATNRWSVPIIIHLGTALPSLLLGGFILWRRKGTALHRMLGRIYTAMMLITAVTSFWIGRPGTGIGGGGFSFIHIFSVWTLFAIPWGIHNARRGNIVAHQRTMRGLYIGLMMAGLFTMIPGRLLGAAVFGW